MKDTKQMKPDNQTTHKKPNQQQGGQNKGQSGQSHGKQSQGQKWQGSNQ